MPDSTLDDVFNDRDGLPRPYVASINLCHGVECKPLRSEQTSSKSNGSAGPVSKLLLKVLLLLIIGLLGDALILRPFLLLLGVTWTVKEHDAMPQYPNPPVYSLGSCRGVPERVIRSGRRGAMARWSMGE